MLSSEQQALYEKYIHLNVIVKKESVLVASNPQMEKDLEAFLSYKGEQTGAGAGRTTREDARQKKRFKKFADYLQNCIACAADGAIKLDESDEPENILDDTSLAFPALMLLPAINKYRTGNSQPPLTVLNFSRVEVELCDYVCDLKANSYTDAETGEPVKEPFVFEFNKEHVFMSDTIISAILDNEDIEKIKVHGGAVDQAVLARSIIGRNLARLKQDKNVRVLWCDIVGSGVEIESSLTFTCDHRSPKVMLLIELMRQCEFDYLPRLLREARTAIISHHSDTCTKYPELQTTLDQRLYEGHEHTTKVFMGGETISDESLLGQLQGSENMADLLKYWRCFEAVCLASSSGTPDIMEYFSPLNQDVRQDNVTAVDRNVLNDCLDRSLSRCLNENNSLAKLDFSTISLSEEHAGVIIGALPNYKNLQVLRLCKKNVTPNFGIMKSPYGGDGARPETEVFGRLRDVLRDHCDKLTECPMPIWYLQPEHYPEMVAWDVEFHFKLLRNQINAKVKLDFSVVGGRCDLWSNEQFFKFVECATNLLHVSSQQIDKTAASNYLSGLHAACYRRVNDYCESLKYKKIYDSRPVEPTDIDKLDAACQLQLLRSVPDMVNFGELQKRWKLWRDEVAVDFVMDVLSLKSGEFEAARTQNKGFYDQLIKFFKAIDQQLAEKVCKVNEAREKARIEKMKMSLQARNLPEGEGEKCDSEATIFNVVERQLVQFMISDGREFWFSKTTTALKTKQKEYADKISQEDESNRLWKEIEQNRVGADVSVRFWSPVTEPQLESREGAAFAASGGGG